jgi:hypothetical protein
MIASIELEQEITLEEAMVGTVLHVEMRAPA